MSTRRLSRLADHRPENTDCHSATISHSELDSVPGGPDALSQILYRSYVLKRENSKRKAPYHDRKTADCSVRKEKKESPHQESNHWHLERAPSEAMPQRKSELRYRSESLLYVDLDSGTSLETIPRVGSLFFLPPHSSLSTLVPPNPPHAPRHRNATTFPTIGPTPSSVRIKKEN
jgi:hypothetical protein